jgi:hypothetical protein
VGVGAARSVAGARARSSERVVVKNIVGTGVVLCDGVVRRPRGYYKQE